VPADDEDDSSSDDNRKKRKQETVKKEYSTPKGTKRSNQHLERKKKLLDDTTAVQSLMIEIIQQIERNESKKEGEPKLVTLQCVKTSGNVNTSCKKTNTGRYYLPNLDMIITFHF
ncbi:hypothetical protein C9374_012924, partial [Naegleria lovaniensis]